MSFVMPPSVVKEMEEVVAHGVVVFIDAFANNLFPAPLTEQAYDTVLTGIAKAIKAYGQQTGQPMAATLAYNLLDINMEKKQ